MKFVTLPSEKKVPAFGLGTWRMGEDSAARKGELTTLLSGLEAGANLIDTAEMYGDGRAEQLVGEAMKARRDRVFLVDKVLPSNASRRGTILACDRSLRRLKTDRIDLYLLHWRGDVPFTETVEAFTELQQTGKIRYYGVSNLDLHDMQELWLAPGGQAIQTNQLLYNLSRRKIEWDVLPWLRAQRVPVMAYSPIEQARLLHNRPLIEFAQRNGMTPAQGCLSWLLAKDDVIVIPKTSNRERLRENIAALQHPLNPAQLAELDKLFPPPVGPHSLEML
jgi:diketogulonate reductase-like aldo/keto reductase